MFKRILYSFSLCLFLFLTGCKCPFCNGDQVPAKASQITPQPTPPTQSTQDQTKTINNMQQLQELIVSQTNVIVKFSTENCYYCKISKPAFASVAQKLGTRYTFVSVDANKVSDAFSTYNFMGVPTFILFKNGKEVGRHTGGITEEKTLIDLLEKTFGK